MLLYLETNLNNSRTGRFIQLIEGDEKTVLKLFADISRDKLHGNISVLLEGPASQRDFADWTMGFDTVLPGEGPESSAFLLDNTFLKRPEGHSIKLTLNYLKSFYALKGTFSKDKSK